MTDEQKPAVCDVRIGWVLAGCRERWRHEFRFVATGMPALEVGQRMGPMGRALAFEQWAAAQFRARSAQKLN